MRYEKMIKNVEKGRFLSNYETVFREQEKLITENLPENKLNNIIFLPIDQI